MEYVERQEQIAQEATKTLPEKEAAKVSPPREETTLISRKVSKYGHYDKLQG